jgi:hypothetical protein
MSRLNCLLIVVVATVLIGSLSGRQTQLAKTDKFRFDATELKNKNLWTQVNAEPYYISTAVDLLCRAPTPADYETERKKSPHASTYITVYVNNAGREAMFSNSPQHFPEGSVIVKEKIGNDSEGRKPLLYTIMKKREAGYNPAVGDWEFLVVSKDGNHLEAFGKLENCQSCHVMKRDSDFVFRPYLNLL